MERGTDEIRLWSEANEPPKAEETCIHDLIQLRSLEQPEALAINAWDGQLTYLDLDKHSTSFGAYLARKGVEPEIFVPVCMKKSKWVPVAMLGISKSGGAFVLLDPSHPTERMRDICRTVKATMVVTSEAEAEDVAELGLELVVVDGDMDISSEGHNLSTTMVGSSNAAYAMFTSGSSGVPKGVVLEHRSFATSAIAHSKALGMDVSSRVLQFSSFAFDVCMTEILSTLIVGGCVCIPSELDRKRNLADVTSRLGVTFAIFTPSLARVLEVQDFRMLNTLVLAGEAVHAEDVQKWSPHVRLYGAYGPTEAAVLCMVKLLENVDANLDAEDLGREIGVKCWVVSAEDHEELCISGIGELVLDGYPVARGYMNNPEQTAKAFIDPPAWHQRLRPHSLGKLYKTGDLVSYNGGAFRYVGRKDNQIKVNGQRLECSEVEAHIRPLFEGNRGVVVELVMIADNTQKLMAFISTQQQSTINHKTSANDGNGIRETDDYLLPPTEPFGEQAQEVQSKLRDIVPHYMVPSVFLPLHSMPLMVSGKIDHRILRSRGAQLSAQDIEAYSRAHIVNKRPPSTKTERKLQQLWAMVLRIPPNNIGKDDSLIDLGGDSLAVIKLSGAARKEGLDMSVSLIYEHPKLAEMASAISGIKLEDEVIPPFFLLPETNSRDVVMGLAMKQCQLSEDQIEDVYPCTPLQEGLIALTAKRPSAYTVAYEYELPAGIDIDVFKRAWDEVAATNPILRSRIVQARDSLMYQVVVRESLTWKTCDGSKLDMNMWNDWNLGQHLARFGLYKPEKEPFRFLLILHHAVTDGWALPLLLRSAEAAYKGIKLEPRPFSPFIKYTLSQASQNEDYWSQYFTNLNAVAYPTMPSSEYIVRPTTEKTIAIVNDPSVGAFTTSNKMKLAWAILLCIYTNRRDVVFGSVVTGRAAKVSGIQEMTGPTIATLPFRLIVDPNHTVAEALDRIQSDFLAAIPYEQVGLQYIRRKSPEAEAACEFHSLLVVQPEKETLPSIFSSCKDLSDQSVFAAYPINLTCQPTEKRTLVVKATFDPQVLKEDEVDNILLRLRDLFEQMISSRGNSPIRDLDTSYNWPEEENGRFALHHSHGNANSRINGTKTHTNRCIIGKKMPVTDVQHLLHKLFADLVKMSPTELNIDENFFRMGCDSIIAMNFVAQGRDAGLFFSVADVFEHPTVESLSGKAKKHSNESGLRTQPFALIEDRVDMKEIRQRAILQCQVVSDEIEDIYPCTPLQEGLMAIAVKNPGMYTAIFEYSLPTDIDIKRFQKAWSAVYAANSILRTRLFQTSQRMYQAVISRPLLWDETTEGERSTSCDKKMTLGAPLMRMALVRTREKSRQFIWTIHHALYDGWSMPLLWSQAKAAYGGKRLQPQPFNRFIRFLDDVVGSDDFWISHLNNLDAATFPTLNSSEYNANPNQSFTHTVAGLPAHETQYTLSSVLQLAWALVVAHYTDSDDVVFGLTINGRTSSMPGIEEVTGPTIATIPLRVTLDQEKTVEASISELQWQGTRTIPYLQYGIQNISKLSPDCAKACEFQSHLGIQPSGVMADALDWLERVNQENLQGYEGFVSYAFAMICHMQDDPSTLEIVVNYDSSVLQYIEARRMVAQFQGVVYRLLESPQLTVREIEIVSAEDLNQLAEWNERVPPATQETLHDMVLYNAIINPTSEAVCAWDGDLTYSELDEYSARLAQYIYNPRFSPDSRAAVCLEKSKWSIVTILGVMRAGLVCVLLDPSHPPQKIKQLIQKTSPQVLLLSETHEKLVRDVECRVVLIGNGLFQGLDPLRIDLPIVSSSQAALIIFTSGSTGQSKAIIMEHVNLSTSVCAHSKALNLSSAARSLHFASYCFDASMYEIFDTLICGGCLCIPSDHDRLNNLAGVIRQMNVNWAVLTPSTLNLVQPADVPSLKTLIVAGENVNRNLVNRWATEVLLINAYGPAEGTCCAVGNIQGDGWRIGTIGRMQGCVGWLVSPSNPSKLAAIGSIGELIIEGSVVTRGYLNDPEMTAASYIERPTWLHKFRATFPIKNASSRLYSTGDLVQYNADGTIRYVGRKDTQVKLRGQRIELAEVEYNVRKSIPGSEIIAEIVRPKGEGRSPLLVACIWQHRSSQVVSKPSHSDEVGQLFFVPDESFHAVVQQAESSLFASIPAFMVPTLFLPLRQVPWTQSGKIDRRRLRDACVMLLQDRMEEYTGVNRGGKRMPSTSIEKSLHDIWSRVLNRAPQTFGVDDSFFRLGGDSISAMQVVGQSILVGLSIAVGDLFEGKTVARVCSRVLEQQATRHRVVDDNSKTELNDISSEEMIEAESKRFGDSEPVDSSVLLFQIGYQQMSTAQVEELRVVISRCGVTCLAKEHLTSNDVNDNATSSSLPPSYYRIQTHNLSSFASTISIVSESQAALNPTEGPLWICDLIHIQPSHSFLSLSVHSRVASSLLWHLARADIEAFLSTSAPSYLRTTWSKLWASTDLVPDIPAAGKVSSYLPTIRLDSLFRIDDKTKTWAGALEIEDVFPCSPIQEGMLLSQMKDSTQYLNKMYWHVNTADGSTVNPEKLMQAWYQVVEKHPLLRAIFYPSSSRSGFHDHLILQHAPLDVCSIIAPVDEPLKELLAHHHAHCSSIPTLRPRNRLTICGSNMGNAACLLEIDHIVIDGISTQLFLRDFSLAYEDRLQSSSLTGYRDYVDFVQRQSAEDARAFWQQYLKDAEPCFLSMLPMRQVADEPDRVREQMAYHFTITSAKSLRQFCSQYELTVASVLQLAWALVLQTYLNEPGACFGYITSGRDAPVPDIENIIGPFINMLVCRIQPREGETVIDLLQRSQDEFVQSLTHQYLSLGEKIKSAGQSDMALFNTIMSVLKDPGSSLQKTSVTFGDLGGDNPTEYDLTINIELLKEDIKVAIEYFTTVVSSSQASVLADTFQKALMSILSSPQQPVLALDLFGDLSKELVSEYTLQTPVAVEECLHDLIHKRCLVQPSAPAVCAHDGDFTYAQIDEMSSILATDLVQRGIKADAFVPLCFEKSRWTIVALLGVVKAGGAFVLLDPSFPLLRLQTICNDIGASMVLLSETKRELCLKLGLEVLVVSDRGFVWDAKNVPEVEISSKPSDALYAVFTSGSTGKPKGAVIEHRSFLTSSRAHSAVHLMNSNSRVLQYTSYGWDVNIVEQLSTLVVGGCICIPSEAERQEDFASIVAKYAVNWAFLTPSMSRIMSPHKFPTLKTLVIGGDVVSAKEMDLWKSHVNLFLIYGPSETSVFCSTTGKVNSERNDGRILGNFLGCSAWVVDPRNHAKLLPFGAVGELLIEGPIVGREYLNSSKQSALAFIPSPSWRSSFLGNHNSRCYKTGDLVRYASSGELQFVKRKDFQIKLRGQRIELAEIEQYLGSAFPSAIDGIVEVIKPVDGNPMLVAFVSVGGENEGQTQNTLNTQPLFKSPNEKIRMAARAAEQNLSKVLPAFMIPTTFVPVRQIPRTTQNKTDRQLLRKTFMLLSSREIENYISAETTKQQPSTESEALLQGVWAHVLNKPQESIGLHDSFFRLGGDSISVSIGRKTPLTLFYLEIHGSANSHLLQAMQVASQSNAIGLGVTVAEIFRRKTISRLVMIVKKSVSTAHDLEPEILDTPFILSPMQKLFFTMSPQGCNQFNQDFFLRITRPVTSSKLKDAIRQTVQAHSMLRARFSKDSSDEWKQTIGTVSATNYTFYEHHFPSLEKSQDMFSSAHRELDISKGPLMSVHLLQIGNEQYLFLVVHHLVIDLVSWRIILGDLEDYLATGAISNPASLSFQTWCRLQQEYATKILDPETSMLTYPLLETDYWGTAGKSNTFDDAIETSFILSEETTRSLFQDANNVFQTMPVELFQAAISYAFAQIFVDRSTPAIWNEGHGREPWNGLNVARTVGWFSTLWPLYVDHSAGMDIFDTVRRIKDERRDIPNNGWDHFTSSLHPKAQGHSKQIREILFNYVGQYQQLERSESLFQPAIRPQTADIAGHMERFALIEITASLQDKCLRFDFYSNKHAAVNRPIDKWISACEQSLNSIADEFPAHSPTFTLSDFRLMPFTYETMDMFLANTTSQHDIMSSQIEDIYPCSPIQRGILLSQAKNDKHYQYFIIWKIHGSDTSPIDQKQVTKAWRAVIHRHILFRTVFVKSCVDANYVDQVVLKEPSDEIHTIPTGEEVNMIAELSAQRNLMLADGKFPYRFSIGITLRGDALCALEISHTLFDGTTIQVLQKELLQAFGDTLPSVPSMAYRDYIAYLSKIPETSAKEYWAQYLKGVAPCLIPTNPSNANKQEEESIRSIDIDVGVSTDLHFFCNQQQLTLSNLFQVAWGLVLKSYVGSDSVCFGYLNSGRDIPLPGVQDAVGPFINLLVCFMDMPNDTPLINILRDNQASYLSSLEHQHCSPADIIRMAKLPSSSAIFNTLMSLQVTREDPAQGQNTTKVEVVGGESRPEHDLTLNIVISSNSISVSISYWTARFDEEMVLNISDTFCQVIGGS